MTYKIINDTHLGVSRKSGTTPASSEALNDFLFRDFEALLNHGDYDVIHGGDLFDTVDVPSKDVMLTYMILSNWLQESGKTFTILKANHDDHPRGNKLSSFELLFYVLQKQFPKQVKVIRDTLRPVDESKSGTDGNVWAIGHCANQEEFDKQLAQAMELQDSVLIFHANYNNHFATQSDHSLNVSEEWAKKFVARGNLLIGAHEHQRREELGGKVVMLGNQTPSSIADCLGNDNKFFHTLEDNALEARLWGDMKELYKEVDWQDLHEEVSQRFVRVSGKATSNQASEVVEAIAKFRQKSDAFVVTNNVTIEGIAAIEDVGGASLEKIRGFNVKSALFEMLSEKEQEVLNKVLGEA